MKKRNVRVCFNQTDNVTLHLIRKLKESVDYDYTVIATDSRYNTPNRLVADEFYDEPTTVDGYLDFCKEHKIDVLIPRKNRVMLLEHAKEFNALGTWVFGQVPEDKKDLVNIFDSKIKTYEWVKQQLGESPLIPVYYTAKNMEELKESYKKLSDLGHIVCIKKEQDIGAQSVRLLYDTSNKEQVTALNAWMPLMDIKQVSFTESDNRYILMPYMTGHEVSVDTVTTCKGDVISVLRRKVDLYKEDIIQDEEIEKLVKVIDSALSNNCTNNVQFIYDEKENRYYLLEVNVRPSGGLIYSIELANVNLLDIAIHNIYNDDYVVKNMRKDAELYKMRSYILSCPNE